MPISPRIKVTVNKHDAFLKAISEHASLTMQATPVNIGNPEVATKLFFEGSIDNLSALTIVTIPVPLLIWESAAFTEFMVNLAKATQATRFGISIGGKYDSDMKYYLNAYSGKKWRINRLSRGSSGAFECHDWEICKLDELTTRGRQFFPYLGIQQIIDEEYWRKPVDAKHRKVCETVTKYIADSNDQIKMEAK